MPEQLNLASEIFNLMAKHKASDRAGVSAMYEALIISLMDRHVSKQSAVDMLSQCWDEMAPTIAMLQEERNGR
jgi:hypothetical protein